VGHVSRSSGLLNVEASRARVFQFASKLAKTRQRVVHVTSSRRLRWSQVKDGQIDTTGCIGSFYPAFVIFIILGPTDGLVFCLGV
jgi:hypothetical protein